MGTKNKVDNPRFVDEETVPLVQDEDYDDYNTPDMSMVNETPFTDPDTTEATSTLQLRQKIKLDKLTLYRRHMTGDPGLADIDRFMIQKKSKNTDLLFLIVNIGNPLLINVRMRF